MIPLAILPVKILKKANFHPCTAPALAQNVIVGSHIAVCNTAQIQSIVNLTENSYQKGDKIMKMTLDIEPRPCPRPRFGKRAYMPAEYVEYKAAIGLAVKSKCKTPTTDNLKLQITFRRKYKITSRRFGDIDNLVKGVLDSCNGILFKDDSQVVSLTAEKVESALVGIDIEIEVLI